jgi:hypothetical protein
LGRTTARSYRKLRHTRLRAPLIGHDQGGFIFFCQSYRKLPHWKNCIYVRPTTQRDYQQMVMVHHFWRVHDKTETRYACSDPSRVSLLATTTASRLRGSSKRLIDAYEMKRGHQHDEWACREWFKGLPVRSCFGRLLSGKR